MPLHAGVGFLSTNTATNNGSFRVKYIKTWHWAKNIEMHQPFLISVPPESRVDLGDLYQQISNQREYPCTSSISYVLQSNNITDNLLILPTSISTIQHCSTPASWCIIVNSGSNVVIQPSLYLSIKSS